MNSMLSVHHRIGRTCVHVNNLLVELRFRYFRAENTRRSCDATKNVTIALDEEVARWVRVLAAVHDKSVSRYVGEMLKSRMQSTLRYDRAMKSFLGRKATALKTSGSYPGRDEIHDRSVLR